MKPFLTKVTLCFCLGILLGCSEEGAGLGFLAMTIENARGPDTSPSDLSSFKWSPTQNQTLTTASFKVTITAPDIASPLTQTADASATEITIPGIPAGTERTALIEAFNSSGDLLRRREITGLDIGPDSVTPIRVRLNTIPRILNLKDGSIVLSQSLKIVGYGDPGSSIQIESTTSSNTIQMNESENGSPEMITPSLSTGLFEWAPKAMSLGRQTIKIVDDSTSESSSVSITVVANGQRGGTVLTSGGAIHGGASSPTVSLGASLSSNGGTHFPKLLHSLWEEQEGAAR